MDRFAKLTQLVDLARPGLEIGPLDHPLVPKDGGVDVRYVDHTDTEGLRRKYAGDANVGDIAEVDVVWDDRRLAEAVGDDGPFAWVVASHVLEHVPDPVGWLRQLSEVLAPGGVISLVVPDKRYCFDAHRPVTLLGDLVEAWLTERSRPTVAATFEFYSQLVDVDTAAVWAGRRGYDPATADRFTQGYTWARKRLDSAEYVDVHCSTFTPESFLHALRGLAELDALDLRVAAFHPTAPDELDFFVTLQKQPAGMPDGERRAHQQRAISAALASLDVDGDGGGVVTMRVSAKEARLIQRKRAALEWARAAVNQARRAGARRRRPPAGAARRPSSPRDAPRR